MDDRTLFVVPMDCECARADRVLSSMAEINKTRSSITQLIKSGLVKCNGIVIRPSTILTPGDQIEFVEEVCHGNEPELENIPEVIIIFENEDILVVDKPAGLVTHPGAGTHEPTLMDVAIRMRPQIAAVGHEGRWGIVHRLDKDTSGVMVIAKSQEAHEDLSEQFKRHSIHRIYKAIVRGKPKTDEGFVDSPIGRDPRDRKKMTTKPVNGRTARSEWRVVERFEGFTLLEIRPRTGRTHQIRAHLSSINMPVLADKVYGAATKKQIRQDKTLSRMLKIIHRQALHAAELGLSLNGDCETMLFTSDIPVDMQNVVDALKII